MLFLQYVDQFSVTLLLTDQNCSGNILPYIPIYLFFSNRKKNQHHTNRYFLIVVLRNTAQYSESQNTAQKRCHRKLKVQVSVALNSV